MVASIVTTLSLSFTFTTNLNSGNNYYRPVQTNPPQFYTQSSTIPQRIYYQTQTTTQLPLVYYTETEPSTTKTYRTTTSTRRTYTTTTTTKTTPTPYYEPQANIDSLTDTCGIRDVRLPPSSGLISGGRKAIRGQFPWLAAYFHNDQFICGGSLVSTRLVVTAAHCIQDKNSNVAKKPEDSIFYVGKSNIDSLLKESHYVVSVTQQLIVHPDWSSTSQQYDSDIAIAVLVKTVTFNKFVKPICIWRETSSYRDIVGQYGTVGGWGKTEFDAIHTSEPLFAAVPVVDGETCLLSDRNLAIIASKRTFCAGGVTANGGPCLGDSGKNCNKNFNSIS